MITFLCVMATVNFLLISGYFLRKEVWYRQQAAIIAQMWALLEVIKAYRESARVHHKEADYAKSDVAAKVEEKSQELSAKIEEVPVRVKEVLDRDPPSGLNKVARPQTPPPAFGG